MLARVFSVLGSRVTASVLQGLMLLLLTRDLGPADFGRFATVLVITGLSSTILSFGTGSLALRVQAEAYPKRVAGAIAWLRYPATLASALITALIGYFVVGVADPWLVAAAVAVGASEASGRVVESIQFGQARVRRAQIGMIFRRAIALIAVCIGSIWGETTVWVTMFSVGVVISSPLWLVGLVERPPRIVPILRAAMPYWGAELLSRLQTADMLIATAVLPASGAGVYAAASRITSPLNLMATSMKSIFSPSMAASQGDERRLLFRRSMRLLLVVASLLVLFSPLVGWIVEFVLGSQYEGTAWPVTVLCVGTGIAALSQGYVAYLYAVGDARPVLINRLWAVPLALLVSIPLGIEFGPIGLCSAIVISQVAQVVSLHFVVRDRL